MNSFSSATRNAQTRSLVPSALIRWAPLLLFLTAAWAWRTRLAPWQLMWALAFALFFGCKWETFARVRSTRTCASVKMSVAYLLLWPGMNAGVFLTPPREILKSAGRDWALAFAKACAGAGCVWIAAARAAHSGTSLLIGWLGIFGGILLLHFGILHLVALAWQTAGVDAQPIMNAPLEAASLSDFWGKRWNRGFNQLMRDLVFGPLRARIGGAAAIFAAFVVSGAIHDLAISVPARTGYGLPTAYFIIQGLCVLFESSLLGKRWGLQTRGRGRLFAVICVAAPAPLLFHAGFIRRVILPFLGFLGSLTEGKGVTDMLFHVNLFHSGPAIFSTALWLAGIGHFCVLIASFQVPTRLKWKEDLSKLTAFNRKLMWVHGAYAVITIIAFGCLTLTLHDEILRGERAAMGLCAFIALYWLIRIAVDFSYYAHADWPQGRGFAVGHVLLNLLFAFLAGTYSALFAWNVWLRTSS